jgi:hypothetical protein
MNYSAHVLKGQATAFNWPAVSGLELSQNFGDGLVGQAAAVMG